MSVGELQPSGRKLRQQRSERIIQFLLMIVATSGVLITFGVVFALVRPSVDFFVRLASENFGSTAWFPLYEPPDFGVWPLIVGTFSVMLLAVIIAVPGGLAIAFT